MMRCRFLHIVCLLILLVTACRASTPAPALTVTPEAAATATPTVIPPTVAGATATPEPEPPTVTSLPSVTPVAEVEPTSTPSPENEDQISAGELPIGQLGRYVNVTFGYQLQYPPTWYTGFGNRPLLVSFSNLDPGTHNRLSMRAEGCLIEVRASTNVYGLTLHDMQAQLPKSFRGSEALDLGGRSALRVRRSSEENPFDSEVVYVDHDDRVFVLTFEHARGATETCRPAWEDLLRSWQWFEPEFAVYRNPSYGYAISYPRQWYRFSPRERGISVAGQDPTGLRDLVAFLTQGAMLVQTDVYDNPEMFSLKEWLMAQDWQRDLTNDIPLDGIIGVRVLREGPSPEIQEMSGYFQGPQGRIYEVLCLYPAERQWEFRPIANAVLYSFSF